MILYVKDVDLTCQWSFGTIREVRKHDFRQLLALQLALQLTHVVCFYLLYVIVSDLSSESHYCQLIGAC